MAPGRAEGLGTGREATMREVEELPERDMLMAQWAKMASYKQAHGPFFFPDLLATVQ